MKRKILIIGLILMFLCGCGSDKISDSEVSKKTAKTMQERETGVLFNENDEEIKVSDSEKSDELITNELETYVSSSDSSDDTNSDNQVDTFSDVTALVDCIEMQECTSKSNLTLDYFGEVIMDVKYYPINNQNDMLLGYVINYLYQEYDFHDLDECQKYGDDLIIYMNNDNLTYECRDDGKIIINDYSLGGTNDTENN